MTDIIDRPKMPEEAISDLAPIYAELADSEDWDAMDVLDAIVIGERPVTKEAIMQHCCGDLNQRNGASVVGHRIRRLNNVMRDYGMCIRGNSNGSKHPSKITYRICAMCIAGLVAVLAAMPDAAAQPNCKTRDEIVSALAAQYQESRRAYGLSKQMQILELFAAENGTWTAIMSQPNGTSCIVASGTDWTELAQPEPGRPL